MLRWKLPLLLVAILFYLQYSLWYGKNNIFDYQQNKQIVADMRVANDKLKLRNEQMLAEITNLYDGSDAIEERARSQLGMIKPEEYFYRIIEDTGANQ